MNVRTLALSALWVCGCGDNLAPPSASPDGGPIASCQAAEPGILEPVWMAGHTGPRMELGSFGKPDAVLVDPSGIVLAGDEDPDYEELHLFELDSSVDELMALADLGADPGPGGTGPLEFRGISGLARDAMTGRIYVVEQGNDRIQLLDPVTPVAAPYYQHAGFMGQAAADPDNPSDGEFVRLQAARVDRLGRLYVSDDARGYHPRARRDVQVFSPDGTFLFKLGDTSYGDSPGQNGRLGEPENFVLDEWNNRIYVCDELSREVAVYRYDDRSYLGRIGGFRGIPNGIDIDRHGYLYVVDEGDDEESAIRVIDPNTGQELYRFGARSEADDLRPGTFHSPDTLTIDRQLGLIVIADQGHDRLQAFSLAQVQARACIASARLIAPAVVRAGQPFPIRLERFGPEGYTDRSRLRERASLRAVDDAGQPVELFGDELTLHTGMGATMVTASATGRTTITADLAGLMAEVTVEVIDDPPDVEVVSGVLTDPGIHWSSAQPVRLSGTVVIGAGTTVTVGPGASILMDGDARLVVRGALIARGRAEAPIHIGAWRHLDSWQQIRVEPAGRLELIHTLVSGGGEAERVGHCCAPILHATDAVVELAEVTITGSDNKGLLGDDGADVWVSRSLFTGLGMGIEMSLADLRLDGSVLSRFEGVDDNDALYLRGADNSFEILGSTLADAGDDLLDTLASSPLIDGCMIYGAVDKGLSLDAGDPIIRNTLVAETALGIAIKNIRSAQSSALIESSTVARSSDACLTVFEADGATVEPKLVRSVLADCGEVVRTSYDPADIQLTDCVVNGELPNVSQAGTLMADPLFIDPPRDYRLHPLSPARVDRPDGPAGWSP